MSKLAYITYFALTGAVAVVLFGHKMSGPFFEDILNEYGQISLVPWLKSYFIDEKVFTREELKLYNGIEKKELYLAILGKVYDVSKARNYYGPGESYYGFVGKCFFCYSSHWSDRPPYRGKMPFAPWEQNMRKCRTVGSDNPAVLSLFWRTADHVLADFKLIFYRKGWQQSICYWRLQSWRFDWRSGWFTFGRFRRSNALGRFVQE